MEINKQLLFMFHKVDPCCWIVVIMMPLFLGYSLTIKKWQIKMKKEIDQIERVNGKEKRDISELQEANSSQTLLIKGLEKQVQELKELLTKKEEKKS